MLVFRFKGLKGGRAKVRAMLRAAGLLLLDWATALLNLCWVQFHLGGISRGLVLPSRQSYTVGVVVLGSQTGN